MDTVTNPAIYEVGSENHGLVLNYLKKESEMPVEYLEAGGKIILSYYLRLDKGFQRFLHVVAQDGTFFETCLDEAMDGFAPGAFFLYENSLCFFKNNNEVCVLDV